jgi:hypothetical protein
MSKGVVFQKVSKPVRVVTDPSLVCHCLFKRRYLKQQLFIKSERCDSVSYKGMTEMLREGRRTQ